MSAKERAESIVKDILVNHLPRVIEGLEAGYVDENQILVIYDHAVRARLLKEQAKQKEELLQKIAPPEVCPFCEPTPCAGCMERARLLGELTAAL